MNQNELYHHGIKGMHWGVRRYQNPDGSLTASGKARYNDDGTSKDPRKMTDDELRSANSRLQAEQQYRQLTGKTQPDKAFVSDTAIKVGAAVVSTVGVALLTNYLGNSNNIATGKELTKKILLAGGTAVITTAASSVGKNK